MWRDVCGGMCANAICASLYLICCMLAPYKNHFCARLGYITQLYKNTLDSEII